jgi:hypothetical protein
MPRRPPPSALDDAYHLCMAVLRHVHAIYDYDGHKLTLMQSEGRVGVWEVYEGASYLGLLMQTHTGGEEGFATRPPGHEDAGHDDESTDDWRAAVRNLIDSA